MKIFTRYQRINDGKEIKAIFWNGEFDVYKSLVQNEPEFVAVLDDAGHKGKDKVKLWNKEKSSWEVCPLGGYIIKTDNDTFTVKTRDEVLKELSPIK
jgi:hypothetical protein